MNKPENPEKKPENTPVDSKEESQTETKAPENNETKTKEHADQNDKKDQNLKPIPKSSGDRLRAAGKRMPLGPGNFWNNMLSTVLLLILVTALFSYNACCNFLIVVVLHISEKDIHPILAVRNLIFFL